MSKLNGSSLLHCLHGREDFMNAVKKALGKGINRSVLYWDKLKTLLTEVEAIVNTCPLTYGYDNFKSNFVLTPSHS